MNALLQTILPALAQIKREKKSVIPKEESAGARRKRKWLENPVNRAAENKRRRDNLANRRKNHD